MFALLMCGASMNITGLIDVYAVYVFTQLALVIVSGIYCLYVAYQFDTEHDKSLFISDSLIKHFGKRFDSYNKFIVLPIKVLSVIALAHAEYFITASVLSIVLLFYFKLSASMGRRFSVMEEYILAQSQNNVSVVSFKK
jgi:hypothetical protein